MAHAVVDKPPRSRMRAAVEPVHRTLYVCVGSDTDHEQIVFFDSPAVKRNCPRVFSKWKPRVRDIFFVRVSWYVSVHCAVGALLHYAYSFGIVATTWSFIFPP